MKSGIECVLYKFVKRLLILREKDLYLIFVIIFYLMVLLYCIVVIFVSELCKF